MRAMSVKTRIVVLVVVLLIAGIWGLAVRVSMVVQGDLEQLLSKQLSTTVRLAADGLDHDVQMRFDALKRIASGIGPDMLADVQQLQRYLKERDMVSAVPGMELIVANKEGIIVADYPQLPARMGASIRDVPHFSQAMATGKPVIGHPLLGRIARHQQFVPLAVPVNDVSGAPAGVLIDRIILSEAQAFSRLQQTKIGEGGYFLVVSRDDRLIVWATERERILTHMPARGRVPLLDRRLEDGDEEALYAVNTHGTRILTVGRKMATTGWIVIAAVPTDEIFAPVTSVTRQIYLTALLITVLVAVMLRAALGREFARLGQLGQAMRRMTHGEQPLAAVAVGREDEIGTLTHNFNELITERNRLDDALRAEIAVREEAQEALKQAMTRLQLLSERITKIHEEQQQKVASELHEQLGQDVTTLLLHLQMVESARTRKDSMVHAQDARGIAVLMLERVRDMALDLRPPLLDDFGLHAALRRYCTQKAKTAGWMMHLEAEQAKERPHRDVEIACFRLVQEALTNAALHAGATEVWVSLKNAGGELILTVRDNGSGFDAAAIREHAGYESLGLTAMEERVRQVGGRVAIDSNPGGGTEVRAIFPLCVSSPDRLAAPVRTSKGL